MKNKAAVLMVVFSLLGVLCGMAPAEDWPTYLHDSTRSGVTTESLDLPLTEVWVYKSRVAPQPAWPAPAKQDFWHELRELRPVVTYDRAFHAVSVGDAVFFGSSADDKVYCLDAADGSERWTFFTDAPVRLAPTIAEDKVYFGSDDGWAYCLDAADGALVWKHRPDPVDRRIPGNGRIISLVPARTGVVVEDGVAYYFSGLMPLQGVYRCALDAAKGTEIWRAQSQDISPQGYLLATPTRLFVPTGRTTPALFDRETGKKYGQAFGNGGAYAVVIDDAIVSGPGRRTGTTLTMSSTTSSENIAEFPGVRIVVTGEMAYLQATDKISALNRTRYIALSRERNKYNEPRKKLEDKIKAAKNSSAAGLPALEAEFALMNKAIADLTAQMNACYLWERDVDDPYAMILAGNTLFVGGEDVVRAFNTADGAELWKEKVSGRAYGLAVANGQLLVSTDAGTIHSFRATQADRERVVMLPTNPTPYPEDKWTSAYAAAAEAILAQASPGKGYCVVLGCGEGRLAYELAQRTDMHIIGVERDEKKVAAARAALDAAGLYGTRVTVHQWKGDILPYTSYFANLVVSEEALVSGKLSTASSEVYRILRPYGGTACIGGPKMARKKLEKWAAGTEADLRWADDGKGAWAVLTRGEVTGSGEWTQLYADANHTANSKDAIRGPMAVQWFGAPGPRDMIDRHHRPMSSLFKHGRLFIPANDMIMTVDGYNGTPLWTLEVPNSRRIGALKNSGQMLVTDEYVYIATEGDCWAVDVEKGVRAFAIQAPVPDDGAYDWGYLNCAGDRLFGTGQARGASFNQLDWDTADLLEGDHRPVMMSQYLFSVDRHTGKKRWIYKKGAILNDGIMIDGDVDSDDGRIYFFESRNEKSVTDEDGRTKLINFFGKEAYLVALRLKNGKKVWERPVNLPFHHIAFLNGANGILLGCGTYNENNQVFYSLHGFDMKTGKDVWQTRYRALDVRGKEYTGPGGSHGEQWQHPVIIGDTLYSRPFAFDLHTGEKKDYIAYRGGHGCGGFTGSAHYLYGRGDNPRMYPIETQETEGIQLTRVSRPGCWLNIIPAGGIIMVPESSSGCTCAFPMQTSFSFIPKSACADR